MSHLRGFIVALVGTLVGVALEIGNYNNRWLANVIWVGCALLWVVWIISYVIEHLAAPAGDRKRLLARLTQFRTLANFRAEAAYILVYIANSGYGNTNYIYMVDSWISRVHRYLEQEFHDRTARDFVLQGSNAFPTVTVNTYAEPDASMTAKRLYVGIRKLDERLETFNDLIGNISISDKHLKWPI
jgi:hypothetical protein